MVRLAAAACVLTLVVALVATADHRHKGSVEVAAQDAAWYCNHGQRSLCRDFDEEAYEQRWEDRELAYRVAFFTFGASALGLFATTLWRRHAVRATHS
jgi:hypothetical protein